MPAHDHDHDHDRDHPDTQAVRRPEVALNRAARRALAKKRAPVTHTPLTATAEIEAARGRAPKIDAARARGRRFLGHSRHRG
jgi:hypothetical protein